jgi:hypothetical protein
VGWAVVFCSAIRAGNFPAILIDLSFNRYRWKIVVNFYTGKLGLILTNSI